VNRAPVLTLWAAVVAEVLGFKHAEALTLGRAVAGLNAYSKGDFPGALPADPQGGQRTGRKSLRPVREIQAGNSPREKRMGASGKLDLDLI